MHVSEAVEARRSIRAFRPDPVPAAVVRTLLEQAARAPSGGNLQPWRVHAVAGAALADLLARVRQAGFDPSPAYDIYPADLWEPYRTRRFETGEALYDAIAIPRTDKAGRMRQLARNAEFFGAPVGIFVSVDRRMGPPQWSDLGMYIQTLMLLAVEHGLATCPQEFWALYARTVATVLDLPDDQMLFCGVALGYRDDDAPINTLRTTRAPFADWGRMIGFPD
ncbi:nitroreductase [Zavarzinia sp. CC-PAN008]|uniref:nitroreductase n=1 Tax=Zavarzinia sp. CC-PAN008 TaxID=3243332 RepID=UPI003F74938C